MTQPSNPFADDPQPAGALRLKSAADPLNPYAAPVGVAEGKAKQDPGIGMWRDGKFLVMHLQAEFPLRCVYTNAPAESFRTQNLRWRYPHETSRRRMPLQFGVSESQRRQIERERRNWLFTGAGSALLLVIGCPVVGVITLLMPTRTSTDIFGAATMLLAGLSFAAIVISCEQAWYTGYPFQFYKAKESYLWLAKVPAVFLQSLPEWPGLG